MIKSKQPNKDIVKCPKGKTPTLLLFEETNISTSCQILKSQWNSMLINLSSTREKSRKIRNLAENMANNLGYRRLWTSRLKLLLAWSPDQNALSKSFSRIRLIPQNNLCKPSSLKAFLETKSPASNKSWTSKWTNHLSAQLLWTTNPKKHTSGQKTQHRE